MFTVLTCIATEHNPWLVGLSAVICALGCFTTIMLIARAGAAGARSHTPWLVAAAGTFGCSVWSLHFVAMLAFIPAASVAYDVELTIASIFVAFGGALTSFFVLTLPLRPIFRVPLAGLALGLGITGMHYVGVAAMRFSGIILYDGREVAASVAVSIVLSVVALARASDLRTMGRRWEVSGWLALAICGLHFTGMSALTLSRGEAETTGGALLGTTSLATAVGAVSLLLLVASLSAVLVEQHISQRALKELGRMRLLGNLAHEVLFVHRDGVVQEINAAGERLFRMRAEELIGRPLESLFADESVPALCRRSLCPVGDRRPEEMEIRTALGTHVAVELSCQPIEYMGKSATAVALRDLTERRRDEARIRHLARHDAVTDLPNRYNLQERLDIALNGAAHDGTSLAVIYIDLDRFKPVNDLYGHAAGDALLVQVSKRVGAEIGPTDTLARIGGDEFVMLLQTGSFPERAAAVATRVLDALAKPFEIEGRRVEIGASMGIALYPGDGGNADALLRAADTAMYRVKDEGRGSMRFFEASMDAQLQARRHMEQELGRAVENGELLLHYQPIANGITGEIETFEALIRWKHPERGMISPGEFIPLAEETGLINAIGKWAIDTACRAAAGWPHPWRVSVNVSPVQFRQSDICAVVSSALATNDLAPARLVVEITEGVLVNDTGKALEILNGLRGMGIRLALDDFGTGYSSLSYLQRFRFDKFKIDKSFVAKIGQSEDALTITRTIVNLGHNLGLQVTAEGVETRRQLQILQALGCDQIQGYLVARPAPIETFTELDGARVRSLFRAEPSRLSA